MKLLRPWLPYDPQTGEIFCLVCIAIRDTRRGPDQILVAGRTTRTRKEAMRFFRQHQRCAPHGW